jgi:hypothetical protein
VRENAITKVAIADISHHRHLNPTRYLCTLCPENCGPQNQSQLFVDDCLHETPRFIHFERAGNAFHWKLRSPALANAPVRGPAPGRPDHHEMVMVAAINVGNRNRRSQLASVKLFPELMKWNAIGLAPLLAE